MKILICIKQINETGEMNRFDAYALEEAIRIKQEFKDKHSTSVFVDVVTVGPLENSNVIKRAYGLGVDRGYHIIAKESQYISSFETASKLAVVAKKNQYDLILTGIMSQDLMSGQTGPMLAEILDLPCVPGVIKTNMTPGIDNSSIEVEQEIENGLRYLLEIQLPAVLTIQAGINTPGYPTLSKMLAAGQKSIVTINDNDICSKESEAIQARETYVAMDIVQKTRKSQVLQGSISDKAKQLFDVLQQKNLL